MNQPSLLLSDIASGSPSLIEGKSAAPAEGGSETGESGFFAQLAQLVSGEESDALAEGEVVAEGSEEATDALLAQMAVDGEGDTDVELAEGEQDKALLEAGAKGKSDSESVEESAEGETEGKKPVVTTQSVAEQTGRQYQAMEDGEELLSRLHAANNTLKVENGESPELAKKQALQGDEPAMPVDGKALPDEVAKLVLNKQQSVEPSKADQPVAPRLMAEVEGEEVTGEKSIEQEIAQPVRDGILVAESQTPHDVELAETATKLAPEQVKNMVMEGQVPQEHAELAAAVAKQEILPDEHLVQVAKQGQDPLQADVDPALAAMGAGAGIKAAASKMTVATPQGLTQVVDTEDLPLEDGESPVLLDKNGRPVLQQDIVQSQALRQAVSNPINAAMAGEPGLGAANTASQLNQIQATQPQATMNQAAAAVQAAFNPQGQAAALAAIPWTPAANTVVSNEAKLVVADSAGLAAATGLMASQSEGKAEVKAESLAQQLASSFGIQGSTTAAKLDTAVVQSPLQMSQNQNDVADALSERVNIMLSKNLKHVDIRLDPPELGRLQIKLSMNQDQASVQFTVASQSTREAVEQAMPRLRELMGQQGLQLAQSSVQQQDTGGRQAFADNQGGQQDGNDTSNSSSGGVSGENELENEANGSNHELYVNTKTDRVDYYA